MPRTVKSESALNTGIGFQYGYNRGGLGFAIGMDIMNYQSTDREAELHIPDYYAHRTDTFQFAKINSAVELYNFSISVQYNLGNEHNNLWLGLSYRPVISSNNWYTLATDYNGIKSRIGPYTIAINSSVAAYLQFERHIGKHFSMNGRFVLDYKLPYTDYRSLDNNVNLELSRLERNVLYYGLSFGMNYYFGAKH